MTEALWSAQLTPAFQNILEWPPMHVGCFETTIKPAAVAASHNIIIKRGR